MPGMRWIQHLIDILSAFLESVMQYLTILGRVITTLDSISNSPPLNEYAPIALFVISMVKISDVIIGDVMRPSGSRD